MKKTKKKIIKLIIIVFVIIAIVFIGIRFLNKNKDENNISTEQKQTDDKMYIGIDNCFLGIYENGKWYNAQECKFDYTISGKINTTYTAISADEVIQQGKYYKYAYGKEPIEMQDYFYDKNEFPEYYNEICYFRFKGDENAIERNNIISTSNVNVFNMSYSEIRQTESYNKYVEELLKQYNIENSTVNIDKIIQTDIDLDGNNEYIIAASSPFNSEKSATLETEEYVYSFIFLLKDDNVRLIMNKIQKASELSVNAPTIVNDIKVCDLNQDSKLEICINTLYWDKPEQYVFTYDKDSIDLVLYGDFTW